MKNKDALILCILEFSGDEDRDWETELWLNSIDRGRLWHVNDSIYDLFYEVEEVVRNVYSIDNALSKDCVISSKK